MIKARQIRNFFEISPNVLTAISADGQYQVLLATKSYPVFEAIMSRYGVTGQFSAIGGTIFRTKELKNREIAVSAAISGFFGITEPA